MVTVVTIVIVTFLVKATWHFQTRWHFSGQLFAILRCFLVSMFSKNRPLAGAIWRKICFQHCTVLDLQVFTALYFIHFTALHCPILLYSRILHIVLRSIALQYTTVLFATLDYTNAIYNTIRYTATALHFTILHCTLHCAHTTQSHTMCRVTCHLSLSKSLHGHCDY